MKIDHVLVNLASHDRRKILTYRLAMLTGSVLAALGVALGAFGAHGLRDVLNATQQDWWQTAFQYQMLHALGLIGLGASRLPDLKAPIVLLALGTMVFSGTLYVMALTDLRWLGMVTPVGGLMMIAGWLLVAWRLWWNR
jgi:uncharacterized membrane protein YgdD (TMEM256/DUF423 family)